MSVKAPQVRILLSPPEIMSYKDKRRQAEYQTEWLNRRRLEWLAIHGPCAACGSWDRLEVDHVDPDKKVTHRVWSWCKDRREAELKKCQALCFTCHKKKSIAHFVPLMSGLRNWNARANPAMVRKIRAQAASGDSLATLVRRHGLSKTTVASIVRGERWTSVSSMHNSKRK